MIERPMPPAVADSEVGLPDPGDEPFGRWLAVQLRARRLTQRQLAQKSGVDHSTISRLVRGDRVPSLRTANLLVHSLGLSVGPDGTQRVGSRSFESPAARVEHALRLDDLLTESQVRDVMNVYLAARLRRPRLLATPGAAAPTATDAPNVVQISGANPRASSIGRLPAVTLDRSR